jgi:hypothetical protein
MPGEPDKSEFRLAWLAGPTTASDLREILLPLAEELRLRGMRIMLFEPRESPRVDLEQAVEEVREYDPPKWYTRGHVDSLVREIDASGSQVMHVLDAGVELLGASVAAQTRLPWVVTCNRRGGKHLPAVDPAPLLLAISEPIRDDLLAGRKIGAGQTRLWRPGVRVTEEAKNLAFNDRDVAILVDAQSADPDMLQAVLRSFAELRRCRSDCLLFFADADRQERRLRRQAERMDLAGLLTFVSRAQFHARAEIVRSTDVYVSVASARNVDLWPLVAMAAGVPVVAPAGGSDDFLIDGKTATLFDPQEPADLAEKLSSILAEGDSIDWQAEEALRYVRKHHDPSRQADDLAAVYRSRRTR